MATIASPSHAPSVCVCRLARGAELEAHFAVRRAIFVEAQALFAADDRDEWDARPQTLHAVGVVDAPPPLAAAHSLGRVPWVCGAVRLYPLDDAGLWKGDRLAVLPDARARHLGAELVRFAVATAGARGGHTMIAQIQLPNVRFFEHLGWHADGPAGEYHGVMHQPMAIGLRPVP